MAKTPKVILLIESSHEAGRALLRGIAHYAHDNGPWSFCWEPYGQEPTRWRLRALAADGIILHDVESASRVLAQGLPTVLVGHPYHEMADMANVVIDAETICDIAAEHLLRCGFKHFAFIGYLATPWSLSRQTAFVRRIQRAGFAVQARSVQPWRSDGAWRKERKAIAGWMRLLPKPVGLLACNDDLGQETIEACGTAGLRVPEDVAVLGVDNDQVICGLSDPPMSSVAINFERAGYEAAQVLARLMGRKGCKKREPPALSSRRPMWCRAAPPIFWRWKMQT